MLIINKKKILYICFFICFIFYLFFANSIVLKLIGKPSSFLLKDKTKLEINSTGNAWIDYFSSVGNLTQDIVCYGWVFIPTQENNDSKKVSIIFKGTERSYILPSTFVSLTNKVGLAEHFSNLLKSDDRTQFEFSMSSLNMKNGIYEVMLYDEENMEDKGLVPTQIKIIKDSSGIKEYKLQKVSKLNSTEKIIPNLEVLDDAN